MKARVIKGAWALGLATLAGCASEAIDSGKDAGLDPAAVVAAPGASSQLVDSDEEEEESDDGGQPFGEGKLSADGAVLERYVDREEPLSPLDKRAFGERDQVMLAPSERIHGRLQQLMAEPHAVGDDAPLLDVVITLANAERSPLLPALDATLARDSAVNLHRLAKRNALLDTFEAARLRSQQPIVEKIGALGGRVVTQYAVGNTVVAQLSAEAIATLSEDDAVQDISRRFDAAPPPVDADPYNDPANAAEWTGSRYYYEAAPNSSIGDYIGLLDTGIRSTHIVFNYPNRLGFLGDCVLGGSDCLQASGQGGVDPTNHGTSAAHILVGNSFLGARFEGVTAQKVDSWKVGLDALGGGTDVDATLRAFKQAIRWDNVIVATIQIEQSPTGSIATAANDAYDAGRTVFSAGGNAPSSLARAPGNAKKAISVGAYDVRTGNLFSGSKGTPVGDNRFKPDVLLPTNTEVASSANNITTRIFPSTSGATPYAGGLGALLRRQLVSLGAGSDPGLVYTSMLAFGTEYPNATTGAGKIRLQPKSCSRWVWGSQNFTQGQTKDVTFTVGAGESNLRLAIWWPEANYQRQDVDVALYHNNVWIDSSQTVESVFERVSRNGALPAGNYYARVNGYSISGSQKVYWVIYRTVPC